MDYRTKDTVTSVRDQEEIATTFSMYSTCRITREVMLQRYPALMLLSSNAVSIDSLYDAFDGKYLVEHLDLDQLSLKQCAQ